MTPEQYQEAILAMSDERDQALARILAAHREGYYAAWQDGADRYNAGFYDGAIRRKHAEHDVVGAQRVENARWELRGEHRTRETFADPHPDDYKGGPMKWADPEPQRPERRPFLRQADREAG